MGIGQSIKIFNISGMKLTSNDIENVLIPLTKKDLKQLSRAELENLFLGEQDLRVQAFKKLEEKY